MATQLTFDGEDVPHKGEERADVSTADPRRLGYVGSVPQGPRDSDAWFTPAKYVLAARQSLGGYISLDPFSSIEANKVVQADRFLTESDDAFKQDWFPRVRTEDERPRTVWMNPPYGAGLVTDAVTLFLNHYQAGLFDRGIILVNNATETKWFQKALTRASALTLTNHRISFWNADGKAVSGNTRGQAFFFFGEDPGGFIQVFSDFGFSCPLPVASASSEATVGEPLPLEY